MPAFHLAPEIHFCASDGAYIFLDAHADRYFAYTGKTARLFPEIISTDRTEQLSPDAERFADHLLRIGVLLRPAAETRPLKACTAACPDTSRFEQACLLAADAKYSEWCHMLTAFARSWSLKRTHSLRGVISGARRWKQNVPSGNGRTLEEATKRTAQFLSLAPFLFTTKDACLFRSLFLMRFLAGHGITATWTFGVRLAPFGAHCWVEYDGAVLNDHLEHVGGFAPILTI